MMIRVGPGEEFLLDMRVKDMYKASRYPQKAHKNFVGLVYDQHN